MRIVTSVYQAAPVDGVELNTLQVTRELARRHHQVHLLCTHEGPLTADYRGFCESVTKVRTIDYWWPSSRRARLLRRVEQGPAIWAAARRRPDVIYANRPYTARWAIPAGALASAPIVAHLHGGAWSSDKPTAWYGRKVDRFVMVSRFVAASWLEAGLDPSKVTVVHNGIDPAEYPLGGEDELRAARAKLGIADDKFVVTYLGRLDAAKGVHVLLDAWRRLALGSDEGELLIVGSPTDAGDRYLATLEELADDNVRFLPAQRDVVTPLHAANVMATPTLTEEPFGRVVIEGLATGRPVIASDVGGIPEILTGPLARFLVEPGDAGALAAALGAVMGWEQAEPGLGAHCAEHVRTDFTLEQAVDGIEAAFTAVTS